MKHILKQGEKGQALLLAMMGLGIGMLVITPFLGHASTNLIGSRIYEQSIIENYSCDAGVEFAIWKLISDNLTIAEMDTAVLPTFTVNNKTVDVSIYNQGSSIYRITSTATSNDAHSTTITSHFQLGTGTTMDGDITGDTTGDVYVEGDTTVVSNVTVDGDLYVTGNVTLGNNAEVTGDVVSGGDLTVDVNGTIGGDISTAGVVILGNNTNVGTLNVGGNICAGGGIILENNVIIWGDVRSGGNVELNGSSIIKGNVFITTTITSVILYNQSVIEGSVYISGSITGVLELANNKNCTIAGAVYATGTIASVIDPKKKLTGEVFTNYTGTFPAGPDCPSLPTDGGGGSGIVAWE